jgi:hypothetical protein
MRPLTAEQVENMITTAMHNDDWATVTQLQPQLDALTPTRPPARIVDAALYYTQMGLHVFPLQPGLKIPHTGTRGFKDATTDPEQILNWWTKWPTSNLGIATGHHIDVIDIDGPQGVLAWSRMDNLPPILGTVSTPRPGGNHLYTPATGEGNAASIFPGVDIRGLGGYVVAPPSITTDGRRYHWRKPLTLTPATELERQQTSRLGAVA